MPKLIVYEDKIGRDEFLEFLLKTKKMKDKVASDTVSRCNRIARELGVDLAKYTQNQARFSELVKLISDYANANYENPKQIYAIGGTWRNAARYYSEFKWGKRLADSLHAPRHFIN